MTLQEEIRQNRPFAGPEQAAFLNLQRTANVLLHGAVELLRPSGLTPTQYNVLRILRGAREPLTCGELAGRMITREPDVTRILDRLERQGLLQRARSSEDRRVVISTITDRGREVVDALDEPMARLHREQLGHLGEARLGVLNDLLEEARGRI